MTPAKSESDANSATDDQDEWPGTCRRCSRLLLGKAFIIDAFEGVVCRDFVGCMMRQDEHRLGLVTD